MSDRWYPPRGAVTVTSVQMPGHDLRGKPLMRYTASCRCCGWSYSNIVKTDVEGQKTHHLCPAGTPDAHPRCPECGSTTVKCKNSKGSSISLWHAARVRLYEGMP